MTERSTQALVLAGGHSRRMGIDKAGIALGGQTLLDRTFEMVAPLVDQAWVSVRPDQQQDPLRARYPQIVDSRPGEGPLAAILTALESDPASDWLVLACDMPGLSREGLEHLLRAARQQQGAPAVAATLPGGELPEPLYAVWRSAMSEPAREMLQQGRRCPRKCLIAAGASLVEAIGVDEVANLNTPEERQGWMQRSL